MPYITFTAADGSLLHKFERAPPGSQASGKPIVSNTKMSLEGVMDKTKTINIKEALKAKKAAAAPADEFVMDKSKTINIKEALKAKKAAAAAAAAEKELSLLESEYLGMETTIKGQACLITETNSILTLNKAEIPAYLGIIKDGFFYHSLPVGKERKLFPPPTTACQIAGFQTDHYVATAAAIINEAWSIAMKKVPGVVPKSEVMVSMRGIRSGEKPQKYPFGIQKIPLSAVGIEKSQAFYDDIKVSWDFDEVLGSEDVFRATKIESMAVEFQFIYPNQEPAETVEQRDTRQDVGWRNYIRIVAEMNSKGTVDKFVCQVRVRYGREDDERVDTIVEKVMTKCLLTI